MSQRNTIWINRAVNIGLYWTFCLLVSSGLVLEYRLGTEFLDPTGAAIWGMDWKAWSVLHLTLGITLSCLVLIHLWMNRKWIWIVATQRKNWALIIGLLLGMILLLAPLLSTVSRNITP
jgi:hypothetical protein